MREATGELGTIEEMFLSCPPRSKRLATTLRRLMKVKSSPALSNFAEEDMS